MIIIQVYLSYLHVRRVIIHVYLSYLHVRRVILHVYLSYLHVRRVTKETCCRCSEHPAISSVRVRYLVVVLYDHE